MFFWHGWAYWWILPLVMMVVCFIMMRRGGCMMGRHRSGESVREILDRRYAEGEIGKEEYEEKKRDIAQ